MGKRDDMENQVSALSGPRAGRVRRLLRHCDPVKDQGLFGNGIATNVGGKAPPNRGAPDGWHIAAATVRRTRRAAA